MQNFDWNIIVSLLAGIATCIPLVIKLIKYVQSAIKEKNWAVLMKAVISYMEKAETLYTDGESRKTWVMEMIEQTAKNINYDLDDEAKQKVSDMIDSMCDLSKKINVNSKEKADS